MGSPTSAQTPAMPSPAVRNMPVDFAMGGAAAVVAKSAAAPVERVKLLLQNQKEMLKRGYLAKPYRGIGDCSRRVLFEEGVRAFWRGNQANVIRYFPTQAFNFAFKGYFQNLFGHSKEKDGYLSFLLGWSVTTFSGVCAYPFDTLRRRLMLTSGHPSKYQSNIHAFRDIVHHEGFFALYRGVGANMLSGMAGAGVLAGYDQLHRIATRHGYSFGYKLRED
ncbi:hypothetical protein J5N97_003817 [Dioscorea zingiberensis]|uniref:ADP/ATP translocase n=1 Tax=Dioscorea zingiberensis TaxID=325984 RepID=A0A9D5D4Y5_9LILI|nr:hypothetical protein J5N97_003817 [Dioscorea zingiberensis]